MLYYRLLRANLRAAKRVVCGQPRVILEKDTAVAKKVRETH